MSFKLLPSKSRIQTVQDMCTAFLKLHSKRFHAHDLFDHSLQYEIWLCR